MFSLFLSNNAFAEIGAFDGVEFAKINVTGKDISFPIGNDERKQQIYYLKKALKGDQEALEIFMGGKDEKWFFIGAESPLWLRCYKGTFQVIKP